MDFSYKEPTVPEDCMFKISPSSIETFFSYPSIWYKEQVLKETQFIGNTSTVLGTICHAVWHAVANNLPTERKEVEAYLQEQIKIIPDLDIDLIRELYPEMAKVVVNEYLLKNIPDKTEFEVSAKVSDGVYIAGTVDNYTKGTIVDYKTIDKIPSKISWKYKIQLLAYAYAMRNQGYRVDKIRLVYAVRPTVKLPVRCVIFEEDITDNDMFEAIETFKLMADTVKLAKEHPEYVYLLFKSMKLKLT